MLQLTSTSVLIERELLGLQAEIEGYEAEQAQPPDYVALVYWKVRHHRVLAWAVILAAVGTVAGGWIALIQAIRALF
jgi:hypothetical protein